jgi:stearoyl-CoA desaturase (delta-9 desaturase)
MAGPDCWQDPGEQSPSPQARVTLSSSVLSRSQRRHAISILVLPVLAVLATAIWQMYHPLRLSDLIVAVALGLLTLFGISAGFHRHFSHRAYSAGPPVRAVLIVLGSMAAQGPPIYWVSNHRRHHLYSDDELDPHSPNYSPTPRGRWRSFWHAQIGWTFTHEITNSAVFAKDLLADRLVVRLNAMYPLWVALGIVIPVLIGLALSGPDGAVSGLLWGAGVRLFVTLHLTNAINSICHMFGRRPFATADLSRNNAWLAVPTLGESWHNNHHAFPWSAVFSTRWTQVDITGAIITILEKLNLVHDVRRAGRQ